MSRITVIAMLKAREGLEQKVNQELLKMVEETHKESGCLQYDLHRSVEDPSVLFSMKHGRPKTRSTSTSRPLTF